MKLAPPCSSKVVIQAMLRSVAGQTEFVDVAHLELIGRPGVPSMSKRFPGRVDKDAVSLASWKNVELVAG